MLIGFAITGSLTPHIELLPLLFLTILSSRVEEIEFRGFGVRQLQRGTRWPWHCCSDTATLSKAKAYRR